MSSAAAPRSSLSARDYAAPVFAIPAIIVLLLAVRVAFGIQLDGLDDAGYLEAAQRVSRGESLEHLFPLFRTRVAMAYPLGWLMGLNWIEPSRFVVLTLAAECVTAISLYAAGVALLGNGVGII